MAMFVDITSEAPIARPLVVRFGALGDMVMLTALLNALSERFNQPCDVVGTAPWSRSLLLGQPFVRDVLEIYSRKTPYLLSIEQQRLVRNLAARPHGPVYLFERDDKSRALLARAGIRPEWLCWMRHHDRRKGEHTVEHMARVAAASPPALAAPSDKPAGTPLGPRLVVPAEAGRAYHDWIRDAGWQDAHLVLFQPGNKRTMRRRAQSTSNTKDWPAANWAQVATHLCDCDPHVQVLICGTPAEAQMAEEIRRRIRSERVHNITRRMSVPILLALVEAAVGMISVDTGPAHIAAALDCPLVVLMGDADPTISRPYASRVRMLRGHDTIDESATRKLEPREYIRLISPQRVIDAWDDLHAARPGAMLNPTR